MPPPVLIDLYSGTVTRPTPAMRRAMVAAEVGDEQQREDPTVNRLQEMVAQLLGKEAGLFLPSGTMCNQVSFAVHCRAGDEIILHETAHPLLYEAGGPAALVGAVIRQLPGPRGRFTADQVRRAFTLPSITCPARASCRSSRRPTSPVESAGHCRRSRRSAGSPARRGSPATWTEPGLLNAVIATGTSAAAFAAPFDSAWIDLTKGLGAPLGAVLAGSTRVHRGGVDLQAAVRRSDAPGRHRRGRGDLCARASRGSAGAGSRARAHSSLVGSPELPGIALDADRVETNIVIFDVRETGLSGDEFGRRTLERHGVRFSVLGPTLVRAVTHLDLPADAVERAIAAARESISPARLHRTQPRIRREEPALRHPLRPLSFPIA